MADTTIVPVAEENWRGDVEALNQLRAALVPFLRLPAKEIDLDVVNMANTVNIWAVGENKSAVVRTVRDVANLPLKVAKEFVDGAFPKRLSVPDVDAASRALEQAGATIDYPQSEEWRTFQLDRTLFDKVPGIQLPEIYEFWAHVHSTEHGARGTISVLPHKSHLDEAFIPTQKHERFFCGQNFTGDQSLKSYLNASILLRQFEEVGADWHGVDWHAHDLLETLPQEEWEPEPHWRESLRLIGAPDVASFAQADLRPRVLKWADGRVAVNFFTLNPVGRRRIILHTDCYRRSYFPNSTTRCVATGSLGYVY